MVCSFLPRPLEQDAEALRVPFFHRNTDYDEFIFYHDGDFFSKDNIKPGYATLHPRGIHHGPHPKALANQHKKTHTDEYAVMLDGLNPIHVLPAGEQVEWKEYWASLDSGDLGSQVIVDPAVTPPACRFTNCWSVPSCRGRSGSSPRFRRTGAHNLAPFSFFNGVCGEPPMVCFSTFVREPRKDTYVNVQGDRRIRGEYRQ